MYPHVALLHANTGQSLRVSERWNKGNKGLQVGLAATLWLVGVRMDEWKQPQENQAEFELQQHEQTCGTTMKYQEHIMNNYDVPGHIAVAIMATMASGSSENL